jgi:hypothetical protein
MDDLTKITGIGAATAKKLVAGGIDTFAKLAAANHEQLEALKIAGDAEGHQALIKAAAEMAPKPIDLNNATPEEISAQAAKIEAARLQLAQLADAVVLAHGHLQGLAADAAPELVAAAETALANARSLIDAAIADARSLFGVPDGELLPAALLEELAPLESLPPVLRPTATLQSPEASSTGQAPGTEEVIEEPIVTPVFSEHDEAQGVLSDIIERARVMAAAGELAEASEFLREQRTDIRAAQVTLAEMLAGINAEIDALDLIQATAPVEHAVEVKATVDSRWRIERQFGKEPTRFEPGELAANELTALKADPMLVVTELR